MILSLRISKVSFVFFFHFSVKKVLVSGPLSFCGAPVPISCARAEGAVISACVLGLPISVTPDATAS